MHPKALDQDGLLGLFTSKETGGDYTLIPAKMEDMCSSSKLAKDSLEVVYDTV